MRHVHSYLEPWKKSPHEPDHEVSEGIGFEFLLKGCRVWFDYGGCFLARLDIYFVDVVSVKESLGTKHDSSRRSSELEVR